MPATGVRLPPLRCSFCRKNQTQLERLIAGPGVAICNECIDLCHEIMVVHETFGPQEAAVPRLETLLQVWVDGIDGQDGERVQKARALLERLLARLTIESL